MEESSENLLQYSEQFDNTYWSKNNLNTTGTPAWVNVVVSPNGTTTAEKLIPDTNSVSHFVRRSTVTGATGVVHIASVFAKQDGYRYVGLADATSSQAVYDLQTGATISADAGITALPAVNVGNGWWRLSISFAATTSRGIRVDVWDNATKTTFAGNGTSGILVWGAQLEAKKFVTSYMPTVGGTATRNADVLSLTVGSWFNQDEGTIVVSGDRSHSPTLNASTFDSFFEFTESSGYTVFHACDGVSEYLYDSGSNAASSAGVTIGSLTAIAASYSDITDLLHISRNGNTTQSGASINLSVVPTTLNIGYAPSALIDYWNGHIKSFRYFPKALPDNLQRYSEV